MDADTDATSTSTSARKGTRSEAVEVVTLGERRRMWSDELKRLIVLEAMRPAALATEVARRWGIGIGLIYTWRRQMPHGELGAMPVPAFAELTVTPPPAMAEPEALAAPPEVPAEASAYDAGRIKVALPCGATVRVGRDVKEAALRRVLLAVRVR